MEEKQVLEELLLNFDNISTELKKYTEEVNIFEILKISNSELKHSIMLSYLLNPYENHGLSYKPLELFLKKIALNSGIESLSLFNLLEIDYDDFSVTREYEHIDIMIKSDKNKIVICIENKVNSGEHDDQLKRYKKTINKRFSDYKKIFLYLTPDRSPASDGEAWTSISYEDILDILDKLNLDEIDYKNKLLISDYRQMIRRKIMNDDELKTLCNKIYLKYKKAFDLIYENKDEDSYYLRNILCDYLRELAKNNCIKFDEQYSSNKILRFITPSLEESFPIFDETSHKKKYLTRFEVYIGKDNVAVGICFGYANNTSRKEKYEEAQEYLNNFNIKLSNYKDSLTDVYKQIGSISLENITFDFDSDKRYIFSKFDQIIKSFLEKEKNLLEK